MQPALVRWLGAYDAPENKRQPAMVRWLEVYDARGITCKNMIYLKRGESVISGYVTDHGSS